MPLSYPQKVAFYRDGYFQVPGVVPRVMIEEALRAINHSVGEGMPAERMTQMRARTYCEEIALSPVIHDLFNRTPAFEMAESLIGNGKVPEAGGAQIALRFPSLADRPGAPSPHLDGMYSPHNGVPEGTIQNFTALASVLLSDLDRENAGNFTVWPGSHHLYERWFQQNGWQSLLQGMPPVDLPPPRQILGRAGDVVFAHYMLGHTVGPHVGPHIRYALFFRLTSTEQQNHRYETMTDMWLDYEGMREVVETERGAA